MSTTYNFVSNDVTRQVGLYETLTGATTLTAVRLTFAQLTLSLIALKKSVA